jgi:hypothetical protein
VAPKDLPNLVQFKVLRPPRRDTFYWFDNRLLLEAKSAFYLKESLGTSIEVLARFTQALSANFKEVHLTKPRYVWLQSRPAKSREPIEVRIPLRELAGTRRANPSGGRVSGFAARKKTGWMEVRVRKPFTSGCSRFIWRRGVPGSRGDSRLPGGKETIAGDYRWVVAKISLA